MRGREVMFRARLAGEEQPIVDRLRQRLAAIGKAGQRKRIRAERKRIVAPAMDPGRLQAAGEAAAEQSNQFGHGEAEERAFAIVFELRGQAAGKIGLDLRPAEWSQMIAAGAFSIGASEQARLLFKFVRV